MKKAIKLTEEDFELFKKECDFWIKEFGLVSWEICYAFRDIKDCFAQCSWNYSGRTATLWLSKDFTMPEGAESDKVKQIEKSALHECLELLLGPLLDHAEDRNWDKCNYEKENHTIIRTLEKVLLEKRGG